MLVIFGVPYGYGSQTWYPLIGSHQNGWHLWMHIPPGTNGTNIQSLTGVTLSPVGMVGGIPTPLKTMKVSWDDDSQYDGENNPNVPNHQPAYIYIFVDMCV